MSRRIVVKLRNNYMTLSGLSFKIPYIRSPCLVYVNCLEIIFSNYVLRIPNIIMWETNLFSIMKFHIFFFDIILFSSYFSIVVFFKRNTIHPVPRKFLAASRKSPSILSSRQTPLIKLHPAKSESKRFLHFIKLFVLAIVIN